MDRPRALPLPLSELPEPLRRFCDPDLPGPARLMAARGLVPLKGGDMITVLAQLAADPVENISTAAIAALEKLPENVVTPAISGALLPSVLDALAERYPPDSDYLETIAANPVTADGTIAMIALRGSERVTERIAVNEARLLAAPAIIEALYKNPATRMSTADRLIDLAARNGVKLDGIACFEDHAKALEGQPIPEPSAEPLPSDAVFAAALAADDDDPEAIEMDAVDGTETIKKKNLPLAMQVKEMNTAEKMRLTQVGGAAARAILVRDKDRVVANAAIQSPKMTDGEAAAIAGSKEVSEDILRQIGNRKQWHRNYKLKRALVFNPKTPLGIALSFLSHLQAADLKTLSRSRGIPGAVKSAALQRVEKKSGGGGGGG